VKSSEIILHRLVNQQIGMSQFKTAADIVRHLGAMQAQEYAMAKWAIGLRLQNTKDADIEKAFNDGELVRTHLLRPTWHFVHPADLRWMLELTAPRVHAINAFMYRKTGLDAKIFTQCHHIIIKHLEGKNFLTREELNAEFEKKNIISDGVRLNCIMMHAELEGLICSGPRKGKQFTYALIDEWVPQVKIKDKKEALSALTERYFTSRGPATLQDFVTWSGLTVKDAREGIAALPPKFERTSIEGREYLYIPQELPDIRDIQSSFLMPDYDEYGMGYKDRSAIFDAEEYARHISRNNPVFNRMVIIDGRIEGTWQRIIKGKHPDIQIFPFHTPTKVQEKKLEKAIQTFRSFLAG
jgi:hypothetical protein